MAALPNPSPERFPVLSFVGAKADLLFWEKVDIKIQRVRDAELGEAHWDRVRYPDHRLVYKTPLDAAGQWHKYYYAADRENQDDYNWQLDGESLTRTYIISRESYLDGLGTTYGPESRTTTVGIADSFFTLYGFTHEQIQRAPDELESLYVVLTKVFQQIRKKKQFYDDELSLTITEVTEIVPRGSVSASSSSGTIIEINPVNQFYDLKVTQTIGSVADNGTITLPTYPIQLTSYIADVPYRFPPLLRGARMIGVYAFADSSKAAYSYDEAWYIDWDIIDPQIGPYEARILRFLTNNPNALRTTYPIEKIVTVREDIGIARWWFNASPKGNSTYAEARQLEVPPTIHGKIIIENGDTISAGQSTNELEATPNFDKVNGQMSMIAAYESKQTRYGLYLVEITEINCTGVYDGVTFPFNGNVTAGSVIPSMGANSPRPSNLGPEAPSGQFSSNNTVISGRAAPGSEVKARVGSNLIGSAVASNLGTYSMEVNTIYTDVTNVSLVSMLNGRSSATTTISSADLAPLIPAASIPSSKTYVSGTAEANSTVNVLVGAVPQVENCSIISFRPQVETLSFSGTLVSVSPMEIGVDWTSALVNSGTLVSFVVPILVSDTMAIVAGKVKSQLQTNAQILANYNLDVVGNDLVITAKVTAANDTTLVLSILDPNFTGINTAASSANTVLGNAAVTVTSTGLAKATVTSSINGASSVVRFSVASGDSTSTVATKASAALALSVVGGHYTPLSSTNNVQLTALVVAANDPILSLTIENDTCTGLITSTSTTTTSGGTLSTVTASNSGLFSHQFGSALTNGTPVHVSATDQGGTSDVLILEASSSPPVLSTAVLATSDTVTGTGTIGATVRVYVGNDYVGPTTATVIGGGGTFSTALDYKMVRGETIRVVAMETGNEDVRSAAIFLTASNLNLVVPQFELTSTGYVGIAPAGVSSIRIKKVSDSSETTATIQANGNFLFTLPTASAGTAFDVYARYATGDSDSVRIYSPFLGFGEPAFVLSYGALSSVDIAANYPEPKGQNYGTGRAVIYSAQIQIDMDEGLQWPSTGVNLTISFPGSSTADIVLTNIQSGWVYNNPYGTGALANVPGRGPGFRYAFQWNAVASAVPPWAVVTATFTLPDGQQRVATFDRATFVNAYFKNGNWSRDYFNLPPGDPRLSWVNKILNL